MDRHRLAFRAAVLLLASVLVVDAVLVLRYWARLDREARTRDLEQRFLYGGGAGAVAARGTVAGGVSKPGTRGTPGMEVEFSWGRDEDRELALGLLRADEARAVRLGLAILVHDPGDPGIPPSAADVLGIRMATGDAQTRLLAALALGQAVRYRRAAVPLLIERCARDSSPTIRLALEAGLFDGLAHPERGLGHALSQRDRAELVLSGLVPELIRSLEDMHDALGNADLVSALEDRDLPPALGLRAAAVLAQRRDLRDEEARRVRRILDAAGGGAGEGTGAGGAAAGGVSRGPELVRSFLRAALGGD
ncbi:MAG: hypothetical protein HYZ53_13210 [Planctomycetes bacterium]|nr:hypothetical protein [Planctomycetota bacterium]